MIVHIVAGGPAHYIPDLTQYHNDKNIFWLSVDRGTKYLLDAGIKPGMAIGDFDSISKQDFELFQKAGIPIKKFNAEKDETDMELALNFAYANLPEKIRIFGATGGRLDHFLANINLLYQWVEKNKEVNVEFIDRQNIATVKNPGTYQMEKIDHLKYISFIPMTTSVENLTLTGFKYPLNNEHISFGSTLCISNELITNLGTYSFTKGILLVIRSAD